MNASHNPWWNENRAIIFLLFTVALLGLIEVRLYWMQVVNRPDFLKAAAANRIRTEVVEPIRGRIYGKNGKLIVENRPCYTLYAYPWTIRRNKEIVDTLSNLLDIDNKTLRKRIAVRGWNTFNPAVVLRDMAFEKMARLEAIRLDLPGLDFRLEAKRSYSYPEAVHILGYVGERSSSKQAGRLGLIGKRGLEKIYETWLGGEPGVRYLQVDATGRATGVVSEPKPIPVQAGWDAFLNIDAGMQRYAYDLMDGRAGSVVAIDPQNGKVITLLSVPDYDPSLFAGVLPQEVWDELQSDTTHPLLNRAVQGQYPPGSTYKMAILAAGLEEGIIDDDFRTTCNGSFRIGRRLFHCWNRGGHGTLDWKGGLQHSCDVFYYTVGLELGIEKMEKYSRIFNFGSRTGIDLDGELSGLAPSVAYMDKKYGKGKWTKGQFANIAIGQGDVLTTPVQLAVYVGAIATGKICQPWIVDKLTNPETGDIHHTREKSRTLDISENTLLKLREAMRLVINEPGGTAYWLRRHDMVIAGKTGTAENPHGEDHGVFVGFAPLDNPLIAIAVIVEHGKHGSTSAAPVAVKMMERYLLDLFPGPRTPRPFIPRVVPDSTDAVALEPTLLDSVAMDTIAHD